MTPLAATVLALGLAFTGAEDAPAPDHLAWLGEAPLGVFVDWQPGTSGGDRFDAPAWAKLAKETGAGYLLVTARGEDGACLWDAPNGAKIAPAGRNVVRELSDACRADGLRFGVGYALFDPSRPDPFRDIHGQAQAARMQLGDLLERYPIDALWLSGEWATSQAGWKSRALVDLLASRRPSAFVNDRLGRDAPGAPVPPAIRTFDGEIPEPAPKEDDRWIVRTGLRLSGGTATTPAPLKPPSRIIALLAEAVSNGGGLLLAVEPGPDGAIPGPVLARLKAIGGWMRANGEAVRGAGRSPFFEPLPSGPATAKGNTLYLILAAPPENHSLELPGLRTAVKSAVVLGSGASAVARVEDGVVVISIPEALPAGGPAVIKVELEGPPVVE
jgi:alpha-L-fucosidase